MTEWSNEKNIDFVGDYRSFPCLWMASSAVYRQGETEWPSTVPQEQIWNGDNESSSEQNKKPSIILPTGAQGIHVEEEWLEDWKERACIYPGVNRKRHGARCTHSCMRRGTGRRTATRRKAHKSKCTLNILRTPIRVRISCPNSMLCILVHLYNPRSPRP
jgi:hypothetical protein